MAYQNGKFNNNLNGSGNIIYDNSFEQSDNPDTQFGFQQKEDESADLFDIREFNFQNFPINEQKIKYVAVSELQFIIITENNQIWRWRIQQQEQFQQFQLPKLPKEGGSMLSGFGKFLGGGKKDVDSIESVFIDPKGFHAIIASASGENYYFHINSDRIQPLLKIRGVIIKSIAFEPQSLEYTTRDFLIGTDEGQIISWSLNIKNLEEKQPVVQIQLNQKQPLLHLNIITLDQEKGGRNMLVLVSTSSVLYCFHGSSELGILFNKYQQDPEKLQQAEVPMPPNPVSVMDICYNKVNMRPHSFVWTNGTVISYYQFPGKDEIIDNRLIKNPNPYKYAKRKDPSLDKEYIVQEMPVGIGLSEYHYYLLHTDGITIISRITQNVVQYYDLRNMGYVLGMKYDKMNEAYWIYSTRSICKLDIMNENKDAWKLYLEQKDYKQAYQICKDYDNQYKLYIGSLYADTLFQQEKYEEAAKLYFDTGKSFEQIFLKFITDKKEKNKRQLKDGLEVYLQLWLKKVSKQAVNDQQRHLKTIIVSWLVELKVYKINSFDNDVGKYLKNTDVRQIKDQKQLQQLDKLKEKRKKQHKEFSDFLNYYVQDDDEPLIQVVYQILQSHGRLENCIDFARKKGSYEMIIMHYINEENYTEALQNLEQLQNNPKKFEEILLKYCHIFMQYEPRQTIQVLLNSKIIKNKSENFNFTKLIGGLMNIKEEYRGTEGSTFLASCINQLGYKEKTFETMNNIFIFFLTEPLQIGKLTKHLEHQERFMQQNERCNFDLDFALRLFKRNPGTEKAQILIYSMMGLYNEAVQLALKYNYIDIAKEKAKLHDNLDIKKKLHIQIAVHLLGKGGNNLKDVIELTKDEDSQIKIEDLLLHFNENIKIEHFKTEICDSLREYSNGIKELKEQMNQYSKNAEQLKQETRMVRNRCIEIDSQHKCEECMRSMFNGQFYIFPCLHGFHKDCLLQRLRENHGEKHKLDQIEEYDSIINQLVEKSNKTKKINNQQQESGFFNFSNLNLFGNKEENKQVNKNINIAQQDTISQLTLEEQQQLKETKEQFDYLLANECIYCGPQIVDSIFVPFESNEDEKKSWEIC